MSFNPKELAVLRAIANGGRLVLTPNLHGSVYSPGHRGATIEPGGIPVSLGCHDRLLAGRAIKCGIITDVGRAAISPPPAPAALKLAV